MQKLNFRLVQNSCRPCENNSHSRNIDRETRAVAHFCAFWLREIAYRDPAGLSALT